MRQPPLIAQYLTPKSRLRCVLRCSIIPKASGLQERAARGQPTKIKAQGKSMSTPGQWPPPPEPLSDQGDATRAIDQGRAERQDQGARTRRGHEKSQIGAGGQARRIEDQARAEAEGARGVPAAAGISESARLNKITPRRIHATRVCQSEGNRSHRPNHRRLSPPPHHHQHRLRPREQPVYGASPLRFHCALPS